MTRLLVIIGFGTAFAAGFVVGREHHSPPTSPATRPSRHAGWLTAELNLTPDQQEQLRTIWSGTAVGGGPSREDRRGQWIKERDEAIAGLIRPEDRSRYEKILQDYAEKSSDLERERHSSFQAAVDRTRQILTPEQRKKYEELLQRHQSDRDQRERHRGDRERGPGSKMPDHPGSTRPGG